jgi:hypothetical protein
LHLCRHSLRAAPSSPCACFVPSMKPSIVTCMSSERAHSIRSRPYPIRRALLFLTKYRPWTMDHPPELPSCLVIVARRCMREYFDHSKAVSWNVEHASYCSISMLQHCKRKLQAVCVHVKINIPSRFPSSTSSAVYVYRRGSIKVYVTHEQGWQRRS